MIATKIKWRLALAVALLYLAIPYTLGIESDERIRDQFTFLVNWVIVAVIAWWFVRRMDVRNMTDLTLTGVFVFYLFMLHQLVSYIPISFYLSDDYVGDFYILWDNFNLIPFNTIKNVFIHPLSQTQYIIQSGGNLLLLLPFAFVLLKFRFTRSVAQTTLVSLLLSLGIESFQFVLNLLASGHMDIKTSGKGRAIDIDDVILNTLGGYLGALLFIGIQKLKRQ